MQAVRLSQKGFVAQVGREHQKMWISQLKRRDSAEPGLYAAQKDSDGHRSARTGSLLVLYVDRTELPVLIDLLVQMD